MRDPLHRLYQAKLTVLAFLLFFVGLGLLIFGHWIQSEPAWGALRNWPIIDIGSGMFTTGLLGVGLQYLDGEDSEVRETERLKRVLADTAPAMRDAVIDGFAFEPDDLARVATPEVLDQIVVNALGLRLNDAAMAHEVVADLREQAIDLPERLEDVRVTIRLSMDRGTPNGRAPMYVATLHWECKIVPRYSMRHFVCLSDPEEFRDLEHDTTATSAWYVGDRWGLDASDRDTFELVDFTVNGQPAAIRRTGKRNSQTYSVSLGEEAMRATEPVALSYTYRTLLAVEGNLLKLRVDQPTQGFAVTLDYTDTDVEHVTVLDYIASGERTRLSRSSADVPERMVDLAFDGWVFPRAGVAFVWIRDPASTVGGD
jgi:hypothetical protein